MRPRPDIAASLFVASLFQLAGAALSLGFTSSALGADAPAKPQALPAVAPTVFGERVDWKTQILPIFERSCVSCHGPKKASGSLQLIDSRHVAEGGLTGKLYQPGNSAASYVMQRLLGQGNEDRMPLQGNPLHQDEIKLIRRWIDEGAILPPDGPVKFVPAPGGVRRLTADHYRTTLRDLFGERIAIPTDLEPDTMVSGSAVVGAAQMVLSGHGTEKFGVAAFRIARQVAADPAWLAQWAPCTGQLSAGGAAEDMSCMRALLERFGRKVWRRPLSGSEISRHLGVARQAVRLSGRPEEGLIAIVAGLLQSPHFLYRTEIGVPDLEDPSLRVLTGYELASRLSFFLWGAPPDDELLDAAGDGRLSTDQGVREQAERLLRSPRARQTIRDFFAELLRLERLNRLQEYRRQFKQTTATLGPSMRNETLALIEAIASDPKRDFREIFDAPYTFVNKEMARLYGYPEPTEAPDEAPDDRFVRVQLPPERRGILAHAAFLTLHSQSNRPSPSKRGKFIRETLLCQAVPPPPPNVSSRLPPDPEGAEARTTRQKLAQHRVSPECNGCHKAMDPIGFAFERWNSIGLERDNDNGLPIDASGELDGKPFPDAAGFAALLRNNPRVGMCVARSLYRFALGHLEGAGEEPLMDELAASLEEDGYSFPALLRSVVASRGFRHVSAPR